MKKAIVKSHFSFLRNAIRLRTLRGIKKFSKERALNILRNDEYADNIILQHYDRKKFEKSGLKESVIDMGPPGKTPINSNRPSHINTPSRRVNRKKKIIFDDDSEEEIRIPKSTSTVKKVQVKPKKKANCKICS